MRPIMLLAFAIGSILALGCTKRSDQPGSARTHNASPADSGRLVNIKFHDMQWNEFAPEIGDDSPEIAILHVDSTTHATHLMIRVPSRFTVPAHWHSANETHTVVQGTFILECGGVRDTLTSGSFNYIPRRTVHRAWTPDEEGVLLFITVDGPWDVNFVDGPPDWPKLRKPASSKRRT